MIITTTETNSNREMRGIPGLVTGSMFRVKCEYGHFILNISLPKSAITMSASELLTSEFSVKLS